jgi:hypothetical protein
MVASLPPEFEVPESHSFYTGLAVRLSPPRPDAPVTILDLCTGSILHHIATSWLRTAPLQIIGEMLKAARGALGLQHSILIHFTRLAPEYQAGVTSVSHEFYADINRKLHDVNFPGL